MLLVGEDEQELVVALGDLPKRSTFGDWLNLKLIDGKPVEATIDRSATKKAHGRIAGKLTEL